MWLPRLGRKRLTKVCHESPARVSRMSLAHTPAFKADLTRGKASPR